MPSWKKVITSGSSAALQSLTVTGGITGSLYGTASWAVSASQAINATTASLVTNAVMTGTSTAELVRGNMANNDYFRILVGGTGINSGYAELATSDDGTEPIYVRQYTGVFTTLARTATLLDGSGNTQFPGSVSASLFLGPLTGTASFAVSSSTAVSASNASTASYVLNAISASFASTASSVNTLNQNVLITGSLTVGSSSSGASENTLTLGARDNGGEGGQLGFNASGGTYTSASMIDNYQNRLRILRGTNAGSDAEFFSLNLHSGQAILNKYTGSGAFPGTAAATLAVDSSGNVITIAGSGGGTVTQVNTSGTVNGITLTGGPIITSGTVTLGGTLSNVQSSQLATSSIMIGNSSVSLGATASSLTGLTSVSATSFTGSLQGTASYALQAVTASYALTSSFSLATSANTILVINKSGATISKGMVVHLTGSNNSSDTPYVITASYESDSLSANTLGIASETIAFNNTGLIVTEGVLTGVDVAGFTSGQVLYLGPTGSIIGSAPVAPLHAVRLGQVVRDSPSNNGAIYVRVDNGYELGELHDVVDTTTTSSYGDLLVKSGSVWTNSRQLTGSYGLTGSLNATSFTGSFSGSHFGPLTGTASYASQALSASYSITSSNALTASFVTSSNVFGPNGSNSILSASFAISSSRAVTSSFAVTSSNALTASFVLSSSFAVSSSNALTSSFLGSTTNAFIQNGNSFGTTALLGTNDNQPLALETNGTTRMFISSSGDVGIGKTTPSARLDVSGSAIVSGSFTVTPGTVREFQVNTTGVDIGNLITDTHTVTGSLSTSGSLTVNGNAIITGSALITGSLGITGSLDLVYNTASSNGISVTGHFPRLLLTNSGSGATAAGGIISVRDNNLTTKAGGAVVFSINATDAGSSSVGRIVFTKATNNSTNVSIWNSGTEGAFYISGSGNVGIGTTSPNHKLDVSGSANITGSLNVGISTITTAISASSAAGANAIFTQATGSFTGAKYLYTVTSASNARTGEVMAVWNGTSVQYTDNSTLDIGSTTAVTASVSIVTAQAQFNMQTTNAGWTIKSQVTYL